jgi:hypothetical protein
VLPSKPPADVATPCVTNTHQRSDQQIADDGTDLLIALAGRDVVGRLVADLVRDDHGHLFFRIGELHDATVDGDQAIGRGVGVHRAIGRFAEGPDAVADVHLMAELEGRRLDARQGGTHGLARLLVRDRMAGQRSRPALHLGLRHVEVGLVDLRHLVHGTRTAADKACDHERQQGSMHRGSPPRGDRSPRSVVPREATTTAVCKAESSLSCWRRRARRPAP